MKPSVHVKVLIQSEEVINTHYVLYIASDIKAREINKRAAPLSGPNDSSMACHDMQSK